MRVSSACSYVCNRSELHEVPYECSVSWNVASCHGSDEDSTVERTPVETVQWVADVLTDPPSTASAPHASFQESLRVPPVQFDERIVHFDLKGAPPKLEYYDAVFPLLRKLGATGLLMEYEDMFPYTGVLSPLAASNAYKEAEIAHILATARSNQLQFQVGVHHSLDRFPRQHSYILRTFSKAEIWAS
ncbi:hypothetical protein V5799_005163 [Amblyomma americanum]|uniref:Uncharacterized protein n=1 Tax=Amblyomma americanum TaxID=6943 RepID=A0AAQ4E010_AMBAM